MSIHYLEMLDFLTAWMRIRNERATLVERWNIRTAQNGERLADAEHIAGTYPAPFSSSLSDRLAPLLIHSLSDRLHH